MVFIHRGMALLYISSDIPVTTMSRAFKEWDTKIETKILVS